MTDPFLKDLAALTDAAYRAEQARLMEILAEEARLRRALSELDDQVRANTGLPAQGVREIGADMRWQGWVRRMRGDLQARLAMVLARKGAMSDALRRAHGRKIAAENLLEQQRAAAAKARHKNRNEQDQSLILYQEALSRRGCPDQIS
ncbi:hypothetical protein [Roseovarius sp.]|jgi:hypothetical protein